MRFCVVLGGGWSSVFLDLFLAVTFSEVRQAHWLQADSCAGEVVWRQLLGGLDLVPPPLSVVR